MTTFGEAKWIIWPIGYRVRVRKDEREGESPLGDIAGYDALTDALEDFGYVDGDLNCLVDYQIEPLNPLWKTDLMDFFREFWGEAYTCENGLPDEYYPEGREEAEKVCKENNLGKPVPMLMADYNVVVEWIESRITTTKKDKRGTNPNSLRNLKQFRAEDKEES
jgi:hypothetical protein